MKPIDFSFLNRPAAPTPGTARPTDKRSAGFGQIMQQAFEGAQRPGPAGVVQRSLEEVERLQNEAGRAVHDLAAGKSQNIHETMIALEKADVSFRLMTQVRNKLIAAYREINQMQV